MIWRSKSDARGNLVGLCPRKGGGRIQPKLRLTSACDAPTGIDRCGYTDADGALNLARYQPDAAGSAGTAPVGPGDNFQVMAIGVGEVDTPPAIVVVDLARAVAHRVGPVFKPSLADAAENSVKIRLADQEGVVLWADRAFGVGEITRSRFTKTIMRVP